MPLPAEVLSTFGAPTVAYDETLDKYVASFDGDVNIYSAGLPAKQITKFYNAYK